MEGTLEHTNDYKQQLMAEEKRLADQLENARANAREAGDQPVGDATDESVSRELKEEQFQEAGADWVLLRQVREALARIEDGTYGKCLVDGEPIEEKRLKAMPWTPYCIKHQEALEKAHPPQTPTL